jgi:hypothetical protein
MRIAPLPQFRTRTIGIALLLATVGCTDRPSELDEKALYAYVRDESNGLARTREEDGYRVTVAWKPNGLIAKQQAYKGTEREFDSLNSYFSKYLYFTLELEKDGKDLEAAFAADPGSFAEKISYLSAGLQQDIRLTAENDTLPALECLYARSYGMGRSQCLVVFERPRKGNNFTVEVTGHPIGLGRQRFEFKTKDIDNAPRLKKHFTI